MKPHAAARQRLDRSQDRAHDDERNPLRWGHRPVFMTVGDRLGAVGHDASVLVLPGNLHRSTALVNRGDEILGYVAYAQ